MADSNDERRFSLGTDTSGHWGAQSVDWCLVIPKDPGKSWLECRPYDTQVGSADPAAVPARYPLNCPDPSVPAAVWQAALAKAQAYGWAARVEALPEEGRVHFLELLAHHLTLVVSGMLAEKGLSDADKLARANRINLLLREVTAKAWKLRLKWHTWNPSDFAALIEPYESQEHSSGTSVSWALERSLQKAAQHAAG